MASILRSLRGPAGVGLLLAVFLVLFLVLAYALKREYWKDVH